MEVHNHHLSLRPMANIKPQRANRCPSPILPLVRSAAAVIDWLDLEFTTLGRHNGGKLKALLGASRVMPLDPGPGDYATRFVARLQDPGPLAQLIERLRVVGVAPEQGVSVRAIEVSFDLYTHDNDRNTLAQLAARLYKFAAKVADPENHRTITGLDGVTYYIGNQGSDTITADPVSQRIYAKTADHGQELPSELHRARYEITLTGSGLPFTTLDQAAVFDFTELAPWFKWRMLKSGLPPLQLVAINASGQVGARRTRKLRAGGRREFDRRTQADTELNTRAHEALRALTRRLRRGWWRVKPSEKSNDQQPISSDFSEPKWPACRGSAGGGSDNSYLAPFPLHEARHQANEDQYDPQDYDEGLIKLLADLLEAA